MINKSSTFFLVAAAAITAWAAGGFSIAAQARATARPELTGQWQLNRDLSDDAREKLQDMGVGGGNAGHDGHGPGHGGGAGRGGHGPGHGGSGRAKEEMRAQLEEAHDLILNAPGRFVLTQDDQEVVLTEPDGRVRRLPTNNRKVKIDGRDVRTKWNNNRLVSETTVGNAKVIETYERSPSAPQLIVTARIDMHGRQVSVRWVYDAVTEYSSIPRAAVGRVRSPSSK